jgi:hypothetical protein
MGSLNVLSHGVPPGMSGLVKTMRSRVAPGFASVVSALCAPARCIQQVLCQGSNGISAAFLARWHGSNDIASLLM